MEQGTEINFSKFHQVIQEYEKLVKELTSEIDTYKSEYEANKATISTLVNENKELATRLKEALKIAEKDQIEHTYSENDLIDNLKKQLTSLAKEKESCVQLWQTSLKTVDYLEEELRLYEGRTHGYVSKTEIRKLKTSYEQQIEALHNKIEDYNSKIQEVRKTCAEELTEKVKLLEKESNQHREAQQKVGKLEVQLKELQETLMDSEKARSILQISLTDKNKQIDGLIIREEVAKNKVREAVSVVESALMEKNAAVLSEAHAREELIKLSKLHAEILQQHELKAKAEVKEIKAECGVKLKHLEEKLGKAKEEIQMKSFEVERHVCKLEVLQRQIEFLQSGTNQNRESDMNKLLVLEKNLESTFQKLLLSERKTLQLAAERDSLKGDVEQMVAHFERDVKLKECEKRSLEIRIKKLQEELKKCNGDLAESAGKLEQQKMKYKELKKQYKSDKGSCRRTLSDINVTNSRIYKRLKKCYDKQVDLTKKWKEEALTVYKTLSKKIKEISDESKQLKIQNFELKDKLFELESNVTKYQQLLSALCVDVENLNT